MKKLILSILTTSGAFASHPSFPSYPGSVGFESRPEVVSQEPTEEKGGFVYVRFATADGDLSQPKPPHPGLGFGYRRLAGNGAVDFSVNWVEHGKRSDREYLWTAPKVSFIHYFTPSDFKSSYLGGGLAWGNIKRSEQKFVGIIPSITVGYEFLRKSPVLGFAELNVSQPAIAVRNHGAFPGLIGEVSIGAGF